MDRQTPIRPVARASPNAAKAAALTAVEGRKLIFTNGSERHARNVLDRLGLAGHFEDIFDIRAADYIPKPNAESYLLLARRHGVEARCAAMVEDLARNLLPAAEAGMTTVWVRDRGHSLWAAEQNPDLSHIDHITDDLSGWLERVALARRAPLP